MDIFASKQFVVGFWASNFLYASFMGITLIVPLFTSAFRHAETLSLGMDARCYHGGANRTSLHELRFQKCDLGGLLYLVCGLACVILVNIVMGYFGL